MNIAIYEVIWSVFSNVYIARPFVAMSSVESKFIGSEIECLDWIKRNK